MPLAASTSSSRAAHNQLSHGDAFCSTRDLVGARDTGSLEDTIRTLKPQARIVRTTQCRVALPLVLSVGLFQSDRFFADPGPAQTCDQELDSNDESEQLHADHNATQHLAADGFESAGRARSTRPPWFGFLQRPDNVIAARASFGSPATNATFSISWPSAS
jgi:G3E family GTPase